MPSRRPRRAPAAPASAPIPTTPTPPTPAPAAQLSISDSTFRDGQQAREPYTVDQIVTLFGLLHRLGGPRGVIRRSEFLLFSRKDRQAAEQCLKLGLPFPRVCAWIRARQDDLDLVRDLGIQEVAVATPLSDSHFRYVRRGTRGEVVEEYLRIVDQALEWGLTPTCHLEDVTRADFTGVVLPFVQQLVSRANEAGRPILVRLVDTAGVGLPWPEAAAPRGLPAMVAALRREAGLPAAGLEVHNHNDGGLVIANSVAAWLYGAGANVGTLLGIGERSANPPIERLLFWRLALLGDTHGVDFNVISEIEAFYLRELQSLVPPHRLMGDEPLNLSPVSLTALYAAAERLREVG